MIRLSTVLQAIFGLTWVASCCGADDVPPVPTVPRDQALTSPQFAAGPFAADTSAPAGKAVVTRPSERVTVEELRRLQLLRDERFRGVQQQIEELAQRRGALGKAFSAAESTTEPEPVATIEVELSTAAAATVSDPSSSDVVMDESPADSTPVSDLLAAANIDGPIDRIGLADSLYSVGDLVAAEQVYLSVETESITAEQQAWVTFQLAACDRQQGRIEAAQQKCRELVTLAEPEWTAGLARWWLTALDDHVRLAGNAQRLAQIMQQFDTEITREIAIDPRTTNSDGTTAGAPR